MLTLVAYLDPGSGSILLQAVIAGVLGGLFVIKLFWKRLVGFFRRDRSDESNAESPPENKE